MKHLDLMRSFPRDRYSSPTSNQVEAFQFLEGAKENVVILEAPTGTGKTAVGYSWLRAQARHVDGHLMYLVPNKTLVNQVASLHPDMRPMYGRNEHDCLFYEEEGLKADEIPCSILTQCPHRVDQETGKTFEPNASPCPYLKQKYEARHTSRMTVATYAFYLYAVFFGKQFESGAVVTDEVHGLAKSIRSVLEYRITDWKLDRVIEALKDIESEQVNALRAFRRTMKKLAERRVPGSKDGKSILAFEEIRDLLDDLEKINLAELRKEIKNAVATGMLHPKEDRESLKQLEVIGKDLKGYIHRFKYALPPESSERTKRVHPLNYTFAFWVKKKEEGKRVQYELVIRSYYVAALIRAMFADVRVLGYSATIADPETFSFENGLEGDYKALASDFPSGNTRIFMPNDTPNLAVKARRERDKARALRLIARTAKRFAVKGIRSLVVVVSNDERERFLRMAAEEDLHAVSYGNGVTQRAVAEQFRDDGVGDVLVGTTANYGEGVDLPKGIAPVIFFYRPGYPNPHDPQTVFEENRFGNHRWNLWNWRVMVELLQVRGRNVRSADDVGVTFLISQQFRRFARASLPEWLRPSYVSDKTFEECVEETMDLLK